jgi:hypothetical protein
MVNLGSFLESQLIFKDQKYSIKINSSKLIFFYLNVLQDVSICFCPFSLLFKGSKLIVVQEGISNCQIIFRPILITQQNNLVTVKKGEMTNLGSIILLQVLSSFVYRS